MKNVLGFQTTEFDCGPTTVVNAVRFLFEREEIPPALIKSIWMMLNDTFSGCGKTGEYGTSRACMRYFADWVNCYGCGCGFPIRGMSLRGDACRIEPGKPVYTCLKDGGCAVMRCWSEGVEHYVLLTGIEEDGIAVHDPYDEDPDYQESKPGIRVVFDQPKKMNRVISMDILNSGEIRDYAMCRPFEIQIYYRIPENSPCEWHDETERGECK